MSLQSVGISNSLLLFIGDRMPEVILGAQAVGMLAILTHQYRQESPDDAMPDHVIRRLAELPAHLDALGDYGLVTQ